MQGLRVLQKCCGPVGVKIGDGSQGLWGVREDPSMKSAYRIKNRKIESNMGLSVHMCVCEAIGNLFSCLNQ